MNNKRNRFHPDLDDNLIPQQQQGYYIKKIPCCLLLMDSKGHMVLKLNETGVVIWELCSDGNTVGDILAMLRDSYPDQEDVISRDVFRVLDTLKEYDAIVLVDT